MEDEVPFFDDVIRFDPDVQAVISEVFPSEDPLDDANFSAVTYINTMFPNEQSLSALDTFVAKLHMKIKKIDYEIQTNIRTQTRTGHGGKQALQDAQRGMSDLCARIKDIKSKAELSERMVQEITRDIKSLDYAKKHLTASITTLNHLHMLMGGVDALHTMGKNRQYRDCANLLNAVINVLEHFEKYKDIERIRDLTTKINTIKKTLATQITSEFKKAFVKPEPDPTECDPKQLAEACAVLDVLEPEVKEAIVTWFIDLQLRDYVMQFSMSKDAGWVDKVDRRYAWFKRHSSSFQEHCGEIFPEVWRMSEKIAVRFCDITRDELTRIMSERRAEMEVKLLLFAVQKTTQFEQLLAAKYKQPLKEDEYESSEDDEHVPLEKEVPASEADEVKLKYLKFRKEQKKAKSETAKGGKRVNKRKPSEFVGSISKAFEPVLNVYVVAQEDNLDKMLVKFNEDFNSSLVFGDAETDAKILPSAGEMFLFFRNCLQQCSQLSTGEALFELYKVFKRYLKKYADKILHDKMPKASSLQGIISKDVEVRLSQEEQLVVCTVINTGDYCLETAKQLEEKLREKIADKFKPDVSLNEEQDYLHEIISSCINLLVRSLETACEPSLTAMSKMRWDTIEEVGDVSTYVSQIGKHMAQMVPLVRTSLSERKYFTSFCTKFINSFIPRLINQMYKCKHLSAVGAEQMLLDIQSLRSLMDKAPSLGAAVVRAAPAAYTRLVMSGMGKAEMIVKVIMSPHDPPKLFVEDYMKLIGDDEGLAGFQRILEMKGLKKAEQQPLIDAYRELAPSKAGAAVPAGDEAAGSSAEAAAAAAEKKSQKKSLTGLISNMPLLSALPTGAGSGAKKGTNIRKLEKLMKRFA